MSRRAAFDRDRVLDRATTLFWRHGYGATSMRDVAAATGLGAGSLYAAFDDKRGLFAAVLARYRAVVTAQLIAPLEAPDAGFDAVSAVLTRLARADGAAPGCLVTNTACERAPHDDQVRAELVAALAGLERRFARALERAAARGELAPAVDPAEAATFLVACAQGLGVLARMGEPSERLERAARTALAGLAAADRCNPPPGASHDRADAAPPGADAVGADHRR